MGEPEGEARGAHLASLGDSRGHAGELGRRSKVLWVRGNGSINTAGRGPVRQTTTGTIMRGNPQKISKLTAVRLAEYVLILRQ